MKIFKIMLRLKFFKKNQFYLHQDQQEQKLIDPNFHNLLQDQVVVFRKQVKCFGSNLQHQIHLQHTQLLLNLHRNHMQNPIPDLQVIVMETIYWQK